MTLWKAGNSAGFSHLEAEFPCKNSAFCYTQDMGNSPLQPKESRNGNPSSNQDLAYHPSVQE